MEGPLARPLPWEPYPRVAHQQPPHELGGGGLWSGGSCGRGPVSRQRLAPALDLATIFGGPKRVVAGCLVEFARPLVFIEPKAERRSQIVADRGGS